MTHDPTLPDFEHERRRMSRATMKGVGMPIAGLLYWLVVAYLVRALPMRSALVWSFVLTGPVFPIGYLLTRLLGGDLFAKSRTLTPIGIQLAALQLFYWPIIVVVFREATAWTPFVLAVLFGSHFLPYGWIYESRAYPFLTVSLAVVMCVGAIISGGPMYLAVPLLAAGCYAIAVGLLLTEVLGIRQKEALAAR
jgi:hypothetical protein